ncbi:MAG: ribonuclease III family protein [Lachnospiraceae bacterium]|jgi:ribonuclease-3|nr:ribonuclease III family protein [Lachnospiraceae bacterium]
MTKNEMNYVQEHIDYRFQNLDLLEQAFTRSSYADEHGGGDNEILEFIGDRALDLVVVKYLAEKWGDYAEPYELKNGNKNFYYSCLSEGQLTEMKSELVQKKTLSRRIEYLGFEDFLIMGKSDEMHRINRMTSVREDLFEAIIGAVTIDSNWNLDVISHVAENMLEYSAEIGNEETVNYIGQLQDWSLAKRGDLPQYIVQRYNEKRINEEEHSIIDDSRDVNASKPEYMSHVRLPMVEETFWGFGDSRNEARRFAAKTALKFIEEHGLQFTIKDEIPFPDFYKAINQLETLSRRGYFPIPTYDFVESRDMNNEAVWTSTCHIEGYEDMTGETQHAKSLAKKAAAWAMLKKVLEME